MLGTSSRPGRGSLDSSSRDLRRIGHDDEIRLNDILKGQDHIDGRVKHLASATILKVGLELPLKPLGGALVERAGRRRHVEFSFKDFVALPIRGNAGIIRVVELLL